MSGRYGSVDGVEATGTDKLHGFVEGIALTAILAEAIEVAECGVALVAMVDILRDAELAQGNHAADAQQYLLLQTVLPVAAIELPRDRTVVLAVEFVVRIKEIEGHAAHLCLPYIGIDVVVDIGNIDHHGLAIGIKDTLHGNLSEIGGFVGGNLLAVHRKALGKVAQTIEETDGTHIDITVRSLFQIVASQHAKTT